MKTIHQTLHLQHHSHTGKKLHHRHTSYRGLAIVLVLATGFIAVLNNIAHVTANSLYVYATNPAPIPSASAVITRPLAGKTQVPQITVSGTCPAITPHVIVEVLLDGSSVGSAACDNTNSFALPVVVSAGQHTALARIYTITNDRGLDSPPFLLNADFPAVAKIPSKDKDKSNSAQSTPQSSTPPTAELNMVPTSPFIVFGPAKDAIWEGALTGGTSPYTVLIGWGDHGRDTYTVSTEGNHTFTHHYKAMRSYDITMQLTDARGEQIVRHYTAVTPYIAAETTGGGPAASPPTGSATNIFQKVLNNSIVVGAYTALILTFVLFALLWHHNSPLFAYTKISTARQKHRAHTKYKPTGRHR